MKRVGIRELRQSASTLLRLVEAGDTIEITDRGRLVALLSPAPSGGPLDQLREAGKTSPPRRRVEDLPAPLPVPAGASPSESLQAHREERVPPRGDSEPL